MIQGAYHSRVQTMQHEILSLKQAVTAKSSKIEELEKRIDSLEVENLDAQQVNVRLMDENRNLFCTMKKLKNEHSELLRMKQTILCSLGPAALSAPGLASGLGLGMGMGMGMAVGPGPEEDAYLGPHLEPEYLPP